MTQGKRFKIVLKRKAMAEIHQNIPAESVVFEQSASTACLKNAVHLLFFQPLAVMAKGESFPLSSVSTNSINHKIHACLSA